MSTPIRNNICPTCPYHPDTKHSNEVLDAVKGFGNHPKEFGYDGEGRVHICHDTVDSKCEMVCRGSVIVNSSIQLP